AVAEAIRRRSSMSPTTRRSSRAWCSRSSQVSTTRRSAASVIRTPSLSPRAAWTSSPLTRVTSRASPFQSERDVVHAKIVALLRAEGAEFRITCHEPVTTSAEAAAVRGAELPSGAKAMLVKSKTEFALVVLAADRKVDWKLLAPFVGKGARFASEEELLEATGLTKGAVPPLGVLFGLRTIYDRSLLEVGTA